jgi:protein-tyrosine-phosphatase
MKPIPFRRSICLLFLSVFSLVRAAEPAKTLVFVCEHGSVKSVIAAAFFNRIAEEQKLDCRAISRGTAPEAAVPTAVASNLKKDGFDVAAFKPQHLVPAEGVEAVRVVAFCEVNEGLVEPGKVASWVDIPPASTDYEKAKAAMLPKIEALIADLKGK